jgi:Spy/CpxP family protein refolding chaperone
MNPASNRGPLLAVLVLVLAAFVGGVAGVALDRRVLLPRLIEHRPWQRGMRPHRDREFRDRFTRELGLSAEQQVRVDSIMDRQGRELRAIRSRVQPQLDSVIRRTRQQLDSVLTPEQRSQAAAIRRRMPRHGPPPEPPGRAGDLTRPPQERPPAEP